MRVTSDIYCESKFKVHLGQGAEYDVHMKRSRFKVHRGKIGGKGGSTGFQFK